MSVFGLKRKWDKNNLENRIIEWANERGLLDATTPDKQLSKLHEEIGEWVEEYETGTMQGEVLELGDIYVVLVNLAAARGLSLEYCGWRAYEKIKGRKGRVVDGTFVKESDL
jgi:NTP pyrophosphatase (non-canonical NTP hydrolase)